MTGTGTRLVVAGAAALSMLACQHEGRSTEVQRQAELLEPAAEEVWTNRPLHVRARADDARAAYVVLDGLRIGTFGLAPFEATIETAGLSEGDHTLAVVAEWRSSQDGAPVERATRTVTVHVDRTPPEVVSRSPAPGRTDVRADERLQATFSEPVELVADAAPVAWEGDAVPGNSSAEVLRSLDGMQLEVSFRDGPRGPGSLTLTLPALRDRAGNVLVVPQAPWTMTYPARALRSFEPGRNYWSAWPGLVPDASGDPLLAWSGTGGGHLSGQRGGWAPEPIPGDGNVHGVATGPAGEVLVLREGGGTVDAFLRAGDVWQPLGDAAVGLGVSGGVAAIAPDGTVWAATTLGALGEWRVLVTRRDGSSWTQVGDVLGDPKVGDALPFALVTDGAGVPFVWWNQSNGVHPISRLQDGAWVDAGAPTPAYLLVAVGGTVWTLAGAPLRPHAWTGTGWEPRGPDVPRSEAYAYLALAVDRDGFPWMVLRRPATPDVLQLWRLGTPAEPSVATKVVELPTPADWGSCSLLIDADGAPWFQYETFDGMTIVVWIDGPNR